MLHFTCSLTWCRRRVSQGPGSASPGPGPCFDVSQHAKTGPNRMQDYALFLGTLTRAPGIMHNPAYDLTLFGRFSLAKCQVKPSKQGRIVCRIMDYSWVTWPRSPGIIHNPAYDSTLFWRAGTRRNRVGSWTSRSRTRTTRSRHQVKLQVKCNIVTFYLQFNPVPVRLLAGSWLGSPGPGTLFGRVPARPNRV